MDGAAILLMQRSNEGRLTLRRRAMNMIQECQAKGVRRSTAGFGDSELFATWEGHEAHPHKPDSRAASRATPLKLSANRRMRA